MVGFNPEAVASSFQYAEKLTATLGVTLAREYATCNACGTPLTEVKHGREEDRDVLVEGHCPSCDADKQILVEEKVWGFTSEPDSKLIPGTADTFEVEGSIFFINPRSVMVSDAE